MDKFQLIGYSYTVQVFIEILKCFLNSLRLYRNRSFVKASTSKSLDFVSVVHFYIFYCLFWRMRSFSTSLDTFKKTLRAVFQLRILVCWCMAATVLLGWSTKCETSPLNLITGAKYGGYGSFLPTYQRSPVWSYPKTPVKPQSSTGTRSPNNLLGEVYVSLCLWFALCKCCNV